MAITTLSEYKSFAGISGTGDDTALTTMVSVAQKLAEKYCNRLFDSSARTQTYNGLGSRQLQVNAFPITAVSSIALTDAAGDTYWTLTTDDYKIDADAGIITITPKNGPVECGEDGVWNGAGAFVDDVQNVSITYTGGHSTAPDDLKWAVWMIVSWLFANRRADSSVAGESIGHYSVTFDTAMGKGGGALGPVAYVLSWYKLGMA